MVLQIQEGKHICLYGGEDIEWIRKFTRTAKGVALGSGIDLEMLYVGKDRARERVVRKIANAIQREKLSKVLGWKLISYFWLRMEKMCISEPPEGITEELTKSELFVPTDPVFVAMTDETMPYFSLPNDLVFSAQTYNPIFSGIIKILSFGSSSKGWAAISGGSENPLLFEADGEALLKALTEHEKWKQSAENYGFVTALARYYHELCNDLPHCINVILPNTQLKGISCAVCNNPMDKMVMYSCCTDRASYGYYD